MASAAEQALLDWRHEASRAPSVLHRASCALRFALALVRISASVSAAEIADIMSSGWAVRLIFWMAIVTWMSFAPVAASREYAATENVIRVWLALVTALCWSPALTILTAPSAGKAPAAGMAILSTAGVAVITRLVLPRIVATVPTFTLYWPWRLVASVSVASLLTIAIANLSRKDHRRWLVTGILAAAVLLPIISVNAVRIAVWLSDLGLITGDVVYLPQMPMWLQGVFQQGPWPMLALFAITLAWLLSRRASKRESAR